MSFRGDVEDPLQFPMQLPDYVYRVSLFRSGDKKAVTVAIKL